MPIYEYRCSECGHTFDRLQQMSDPDPEECPSCGGDEVGRLISESSFQLKGGGWFDDGYGSTSGAGGSGEDATSSDDGSSGDDEPAAAE